MTFPTHPARCLLSILWAALVLWPTGLQAGRYPASGTQGFSYPDGTTHLGDGTVISSSNGVAAVTSSALRLTDRNTQYTYSSFKLPDLDPGLAASSWEVAVSVRMDRQTFGTPADGWALNIGPIPEGYGEGEGGFAMANGLVIAFDTYNNGNDPPGIEIFADGVSVANFPQTFQYSTQTYRPLIVRWDQDGLDVTYTVNTTPVAICTNLPVPGYRPAAGHQFALSARTGSRTMGTRLDNLTITTLAAAPLETGGPVIAEFCAENGGSLEDENGDESDWIEIYNGQPAPANMAGWLLSDSAADPGKWLFPAVTIPAYGYLTVFASSKNRTDPASQLHTNFRIGKDGGYLALRRADGALASEFDYGTQVADVTYGLLPREGGYTYGYLETPTPGRAYTGMQAAGPPAEEVVFLRDGQPVSGGLFVTGFNLAVQPLAAPESVVRYTLDNTVPSATSPVFPGSLAVSATTTVRARVFTPDLLPGPVASRSFLQLDTSLANYNGSGKPFSSTLPIIVLDSFGVPVDSFSESSQPRPYRLSYGVTIDADPLADNRAVITGPADFQGRCGTHVRGETSAGFPQKGYAWEIWDNNNEDKNEPILGFPADSDWVLHNPYTDKTMMRNFISYDRMRALNGTSGGMGVRFVELFFNQDGGTVTASDYRGIYVLVEKIKRDPDRVDIARLTAAVTDPAMLSGGYIFKKDKAGVGNTSFTTATNNQTFQFVTPEDPNPQQVQWLRTYMNSFEAALNGTNFADPATGYAAYIDPLSFVDNQWLVEITKQIDGYRLSTYFSKDRDGRVRALPVWDYNLSLFNANYNGGDSHSGWYYSQLGSADYYYWPRLHQDPNYRILHWDRYWELRRGLFETTAMLNYIDGLAAQLTGGSATPVTNSMPARDPLSENPAMRHFRKWPILGTYVWPNPVNFGARTKFWNGPTLNPAYYTGADAEVDAMKSFLARRLEWIDDQNYSGSVIYRPPVFSHGGGSVPAGTTLTISRHTGTPPAGFSYATGGTLYYTTDGSDPRAANGTPVGTAYTGPVELTGAAAVRARLYANGNWSPVTAADFVIEAAPASAANLVIAELHYKPVVPEPGSPEYDAGYISGTDFEFVELLNVSAGHVDLTGCRFSQGITFDFAAVPPNKRVVPPGGRALVVGNATAFAMRYSAAAADFVIGVFSGNLNNGGETVTLLAADQSVIARVTYGPTEPWPLAANTDGYSLTLNHPAPNPDYSPLVFRASAEVGGTPGAPPGPAFVPNPETGDPLTDSDGDGHADLLEYATNSDPANAADIRRPLAGEVIVDAIRHLTLSYRRDNAADGIDCAVEFSSDLTGWASDGSAVVYVGTVNHGDGTSTVTYRATRPMGEGAEQFLRLRVALP